MTKDQELLPCNMEAEERVLGKILLHDSELAMIADELEPRHFYKDAHRTIYTAMIHLYERHHSYDQFSISDHLDRQEKLEDAGGEFYIGMLIERAFECQDVLADAEKIIDTWTRRQLMEASQADAYDAYHA